MTHPGPDPSRSCHPAAWLLAAIGLLTAPLVAQGPLFFSQDATAQGLFSLDLATGAATLLGTTTVTGTTCGLAPSNDPTLLYGSKPFGVLHIQISGAGATTFGSAGIEALAWDPTTSTLYGCINGNFATYDHTTGLQTGALAGPGTDVEGLAWDNGIIHGIGPSGTLYRYDIAAGTWSMHTTTTLSGWDNGGLAYDPGQDVLYTKYQGDVNLYQVDKDTGIVTTIGSTGISGGGGLAYMAAALNCTLTGPAAPTGGNIVIDLDSSSAGSPTVDVTFDFSTDAGAAWSPCTAAGSSPTPNPATGVPTGPASFTWDSVADGVGLAAVATGVLVRASITDGVAPYTGICMTAPFDVDNVIPPPTCSLTPPGTTVIGDVLLDLDTASPSAATVDITFEYTTDGGATWTPCTAAPGSTLPNPAPGVATGLVSFTWASRTDGVGLAAIATGVLVRAQLVDGVSPLTGECVTPPLDVDNTALCPGTCGDCNLSGTGPDILDALTAAQMAAGLLTPTLAQTGCCDVDSTASITVLDALLMARQAAGLAATLVCP